MKEARGTRQKVLDSLRYLLRGRSSGPGKRARRKRTSDPVVECEWSVAKQDGRSFI
ncbi:hypothetical protein DPMN_031487 [Dreissena polymorpha]|uniref:Uncharacterized protein n=1 Tax=Dreissena polymorpha TaxID=45954 RepID=A0A9D4M2W8_DREPO|nr:hypothetical protein DPMN_031487 [Dreissena polymorpha]